MPETNTYLRILRDPLWQFAGVAVTLLLFLLQGYATGQSGEVRITLAASNKVISEGIDVPGVTHKTEIDGKVVDNYQTATHIFVMQNKSTRALVPSEVGAPLRITPAYDSDILHLYAFPTGAGAPPVPAQKAPDGTWSISVPLLNPDQQLEIVTYVHSGQLIQGIDYAAKNAALRNSAPTLFWHVPNLRTNTYTTVDQIPYTVESFNPLNVQIFLSGKGIFQVLIIFALLHYISVLLFTPVARSISNTRAAFLWVALPVLTISAAESIYHLLVRSSAIREALGTSPLNYVIAVIWICLHLVMIKVSMRSATRLPVKPA
jgi:hypothetical protein